MDVLIVTSNLEEIDAEAFATILIQNGYYVHSVVVRSTTGRTEDRWHDGNE